MKNPLKFFSKYLEEGVLKIKQYLKYILMIINQNILATLLTFSNLPKNLYEKLYIPKRQLPQPPLLNLLANFLIERFLISR